MSEYHRKTLKKFHTIINSLPFQIRSARVITVECGNGEEVKAVELTGAKHFRAHLTASGEILFGNTTEHPARGAEGRNARDSASPGPIVPAQVTELILLEILIAPLRAVSA